MGRQGCLQTRTGVSVAPATILPAMNTLPTWPDSDSDIDAGRVPPDVLHALEEDASHGEGESVATVRASARPESLRITPGPASAGVGTPDCSVKGQSLTSIQIATSCAFLSSYRRPR